MVIGIKFVMTPINITLAVLLNSLNPNRVMLGTSKTRNSGKPDPQLVCSGG